jgi:hypothetical protein
MRPRNQLKLSTSEFEKAQLSDSQQAGDYCVAENGSASVAACCAITDAEASFGISLLAVSIMAAGQSG